jgi:hypothetical protein
MFPVSNEHLRAGGRRQNQWPPAEDAELLDRRMVALPRFFVLPAIPDALNGLACLREGEAPSEPDCAVARREARPPRIVQGHLEPTETTLGARIRKPTHRAAVANETKRKTTRYWSKAPRPHATSARLMATDAAHTSTHRNDMNAIFGSCNGKNATEADPMWQR